MKLEPIAKPIKIRIKLGNTEYSTFEDVKNNFSLEELYPLFKDGRLERWLVQIGKCDLATKVRDMEVMCGNGDIYDYILFLSLFFDNISDSLLDTNVADGKWNLNEYFNNASPEVLEIIYRYIKETKDSNKQSLVNKLLNKDEFWAFFDPFYLYKTKQKWQ